MGNWPANSAIITMQIDGRNIVRSLREKAVHVVYDRSAQYFRFTDDGPQKAAPWPSYHIAFLLDSEVSRRPIPDITSTYVQAGIKL